MRFVANVKNQELLIKLLCTQCPISDYLSLSLIRHFFGEYGNALRSVIAGGGEIKMRDKKNEEENGGWGGFFLFLFLHPESH